MQFDELFAKRSTQIKPGLERIERSYKFLGSPARQIPAALIGGTNGKGSTCGFLWYLLALNNKNIGLFSSPHLVAFSERCQLSCNPSSDTELTQLWQSVKTKLPEELYDELSFFELATLLAFELFQTRQVDFQVLEVGLGGRWDTTNISDPLLSAVVSVSRDHAEYLGSDLEQIMLEKSAIMRPGRPFFWGSSGEILEIPGYQLALLEQAAACGSPLYQSPEHFYFDRARESIVLRIPDLPPLHLPLVGILKSMPTFLCRNLALAAAMYQYLECQHPDLQLKAIEQIWPELGLGGAPAPFTLYGRSQRLAVPSHKGSIPLLLDVCHNVDGAKAFLEGLAGQGFGKSMPVLVSILKDKETDLILDVLRSQLQPVILFGIEHERGWNPNILASRHRDLAFFSSFEDAWAEFVKTWQPADGPVAICGSVLVVGQVLQYFAAAPQDGVSLERILRGDW